MIKQLYDLQLNNEFVVLAKQHGIIVYGAGGMGTTIVPQLLGLQYIRGGWGGGYYDTQISQYLDGAKIHGIVDADKAKHGKEICNIPIIDLAALSDYDKQTPILITAMHYYPSIARNLQSMGFMNLFATHTYAIMVSNQIENMEPTCSAEDLEEYRQEIEQARKLFKEEKSLRVFDARMEWLFHGRIDSLMREYDSTVRQYYPLDIISLHDKEVYVDCGVYDGGTIMDFVGMSGRKYQWIYGFEADETCIPRIQTFTKGVGNFELFNFGVSDKEGVAYYSGNNQYAGGHIITESTDISVELKLNSLDNLLLDKPYAPTFIKMDIEGSEIDALNGARNIIQRDKPKLAISAYHKPTDLWRIPLLIHEIMPEYKLYLRHHSGLSSHTETVIYAVI